jgi:hypothetical protein
MNSRLWLLLPGGLATGLLFISGCGLTSECPRKGRVYITMGDLGSEIPPEAAKKEPGYSGIAGCVRRGDEIWSWQTPAETWQRQAGRAGLAVVRNGEVVGVIVTAIQ